MCTFIQFILYNLLLHSLTEIISLYGPLTIHSFRSNYSFSPFNNNLLAEIFGDVGVIRISDMTETNETLKVDLNGASYII